MTFKDLVASFLLFVTSFLLFVVTCWHGSGRLGNYCYATYWRGSGSRELLSWDVLTWHHDFLTSELVGLSITSELVEGLILPTCWNADMASQFLETVQFVWVYFYHVLKWHRNFSQQFSLHGVYFHTCWIGTVISRDSSICANTVHYCENNFNVAKKLFTVAKIQFIITGPVLKSQRTVLKSQRPVLSPIFMVLSPSSVPVTYF